ncbi:MAG TPA: hypothetical protein VH374_21395 [Polyangia bacterium]|nr:hypothetical protein [Polyangia bacterium]
MGTIGLAGVAASLVDGGQAAFRVSTTTGVTDRSEPTIEGGMTVTPLNGPIALIKMTIPVAMWAPAVNSESVAKNNVNDENANQYPAAAMTNRNF